MPLINLHDRFILNTTEEPLLVYDATQDEELIESRTKIVAYIIIASLLDRLEANYY
jgi:hypothetical protein